VLLEVVVCLTLEVEEESIIREVVEYSLKVEVVVIVLEALES